MPSLAHRLALVAAGEADAAIGINAPRVWEYAAGHALLHGAGGSLVNQAGQEVRYDSNGFSEFRLCAGGGSGAVDLLIRRRWSPVDGTGHADAGAPQELQPSQLIANRCSDPKVLQPAQGCLLGQVTGMRWAL